MGLPYENASSGKAAIEDIEKILRRFGCASIGNMMDYEKGELIVQFKYRQWPITIKASINGYAVAWLREHPWSHRSRKSKVEHERIAKDIAGKAVYSIIRDWVKGQITAVECGILSFEGAFLGQIMLPNGETVMERIQQTELLQLAAPQQDA